MSKHFLTSSKTPGIIKEKNFAHPQERMLFDEKTDGYVLPGIIDVHFHGAKGWDFAFGEEERIEEMLDAVLASGVTGLMATVMTCPEPHLEKVLSTIAHIAKNRKVLPIIHGIHLEGPFISYEKRGAHPAEDLMHPSVDLLKKWQTIAKGMIKVITVAPELPGSGDFIKEALKMGIKVSLGHSNADWKTAAHAVELGASCITHLFNAMPHIHHRNPNILSYALTNKTLYYELIGDCEHISPEIVQMVTQSHDANKLLIISDSMALTGLSDGWYEFYNQTLAKTKTRSRLPDGNFFGGALTLPHCMNRLAKEAGISWGTIGQSVWRNPCDFLGITAPDAKIYFDTDMNWIATQHEGVWYRPVQQD